MSGEQIQTGDRVSVESLRREKSSSALGTRVWYKGTVKRRDQVTRELSVYFCTLDGKNNYGSRYYNASELERLCRHCDELLEEHGRDGKCLFGPTSYA